MDKNSSGIGYLIAFLFVALLGFGIYWFAFKPDNSVKTDDNSGGSQVEDDTTKTPTDTTTPGVDDTDTDTTDSDTETEEETPPVTDEDTSATDFSSFSSSKQTVGESTNTDKYTLKSISDSKKDGYHQFVFVVQAKTSETMESPYVEVSYNSAQGAIRVDFAGITTDNSGIGYQKSRTINEQGVIRLYHNISSDATEELYDIGITKKTVFKLTTSETTDNTWNIGVKVKYPGGTISTGVIGSEDFSKDLQALDGGLSPDTPKIGSYSYSGASGVLTLVFNVSGSATRPFPSATGQYKSGTLQLEFPYLTTDAVANALDGKKLSGITIQTVRSGNKSTYYFEGATKEFRLSASTSPNQVVMEIKL